MNIWTVSRIEYRTGGGSGKYGGAEKDLSENVVGSGGRESAGAAVEAWDFPSQSGLCAGPYASREQSEAEQ